MNVGITAYGCVLEYVTQTLADPVMSMPPSLIWLVIGIPFSPLAQ